MANTEDTWDSHDHQAVVHSHRHYHVTHNFLESSGGFEHLSAAHDHDHDHAAVTHSHHPHERFEEEHSREAHVHDHAEPVQDGEADGAAAKPRKAAKKATAKVAGSAAT